MTRKEYENMLSQIEGSTIAVVYVFQGEVV